MRRTDILLAILVVVLAVGLIVGPPLVEKWREAGDGQQAEAMDEEADTEAGPDESDAEAQNAALAEAAELERVSGMLMLYQACANRIDGFDEEGRPVMEAWKQQHADVLAKRGAEPDFHIVLADPEGIERSAEEKARTEETALCERNLEAMRADMEEAPEQESSGGLRK